MQGVEIETTTRTKQRALHELLRSFGSVCIGYSGGVDSVYLVQSAVDALGRDRVLAVTGTSAAYPDVQRDDARACAERIGVRHIEIETHELSDPSYTANPSNRCYFCKVELWRRLRAVADEHDLGVLADGANADDAGDYRPGREAGREHGVRSPLLEVRITKSEVRALSRERGLPTWDRPAAPCLSSRIPYGLAVTRERLRQVEAAETALRAVGFRELRVRHHGAAARIELARSEQARALDLAHALDRDLRALGFSAVLLDVEGYRRGALNEGLVALCAPRSGPRVGGTASALDGNRSASAPGATRPEAPSSRPSSNADARIERLATLVAAEGIGANGVRAAGHEREIAVVEALPSSTPRLASVAPAVRALGFRYVTVDLTMTTDRVATALNDDG